MTHFQQNVKRLLIIHRIKVCIQSRLSFKLGEQERYNTKFEREDSSFTFLVPTNEAWQTLKGKYATAFKVILIKNISALQLNIVSNKYYE